MNLVLVKLYNAEAIRVGTNVVSRGRTSPSLTHSLLRIQCCTRAKPQTKSRMSAAGSQGFFRDLSQSPSRAPLRRGAFQGPFDFEESLECLGLDTTEHCNFFRTKRGRARWDTWRSTGGDDRGEEVRSDL